MADNTKKKNLFDEAEDDEEKVEEEDDEVVDHEDLSLPLLVPRNDGASSSRDDHNLLDWKMKFTPDLSREPKEEFFGRRGFSAVGFLGPEDIEELEDESSGDSEFEEVDSFSYLSTLFMDYMQIFMSLVVLLKRFQNWARAFETYFNLLQIVLFLVLLFI